MAAITNLTELENMDLTGSHTLVNDIDASATAKPGYNNGAGWKPLGAFAAPPEGPPFSGVLDGQGHTIKNLYIHRPGVNGVALFKAIYGGVVKNVKFENVNIIGGANTGVIYSTLDYGGSVEDCHIISGSVIGANYVGGIAGKVNEGNITLSSNKASITGVSYVGGIVGDGYISSGKVSLCFSIADIEATSSSAGGGVVGAAQAMSQFENCFARGSVTAQDKAGGFAGEMIHASGATNCYASCSVTGTTNVGGFVGRGAIEEYPLSSGMTDGIKGCFYDIGVYGTDDGNVGPATNAKGLTTAQMKNIASFTTIDEYLIEAWDFVGNPNDDEGTNNYWALNALGNDAYPILSAFNEYGSLDISAVSVQEKVTIASIKVTSSISAIIE